MGAAAFRARLYRMFLKGPGTPPPVVDTMTPSQIAASLGLDELDAPEGDEYVVARAVENVPAPPRADLDRSLSRSERMRLAAEQAAKEGIEDPELDQYRPGAGETGHPGGEEN